MLLTIMAITTMMTAIVVDNLYAELIVKLVYKLIIAMFKILKSIII